MRSTRLPYSQEFSELVGTEYSKADCWRLAQLFYVKVFGIELKSYYEHTPQDRSDRKNLIFTNVGEFKKVDKPDFGDLILLKILGIESHIAIYLGDGTMLHTSEKTGAVVEPIARWKKQIVGYYRVNSD